MADGLASVERSGPGSRRREHHSKFTGMRQLASIHWRPLKPAATTSGTAQPSSSTASRARLNAVGYLYVPAACENGAPAAVACGLHVAFHGCLQYVDAIHDRFFRDAGYNAFADANHVVVLYPQATSWRRLTDPSGLTANPDGCWDWWG